MFRHSVLTSPTYQLTPINGGRVTCLRDALVDRLGREGGGFEEPRAAAERMLRLVVVFRLEMFLADEELVENV